MKRNPSEIESILKNRICRICTDRNAEGECGREDPSTCALFRLFPLVVQTIQSMDSTDIRDYVDAIRENVCSACDEQVDGRCEARNQVRCALDAYLIPVVEAIEEATGQIYDLGALPAPALLLLRA